MPIRLLYIFDLFIAHIVNHFAEYFADADSLQWKQWKESFTVTVSPHSTRPFVFWPFLSPTSRAPFLSITARHATPARPCMPGHANAHEQFHYSIRSAEMTPPLFLFLFENIIIIIYPF